MPGGGGGRGAGRRRGRPWHEVKCTAFESPQANTTCRIQKKFSAQVDENPRQMMLGCRPATCCNLGAWKFTGTLAGNSSSDLQERCAVVWKRGQVPVVSGHCLCMLCSKELQHALHDYREDNITAGSLSSRLAWHVPQVCVKCIT